MPYNNSPITPAEEITGTSALPLARVKKIIAQDDEIAQCSNSAAFAISVATEMFVRYLTEQAHVVVKSERKPRRNIAYKDIATAISRVDNLEFLSDVVPRTKTYRQIKEDKAREDEATTSKTTATSSNGGNNEPGTKSIDQMIQQQHQVVNGNHANGQGPTNGATEQSQSTLAERPNYQNGHGHHHQAQADVEMSG